MSLRVAPFPHLLAVINPDWVLLGLIYWTIRLPYRTGVFTAWLVGLFTDVLMGRTLGEYALIYAVLNYFTITGHKRLRQYPLIQQSVYVFGCLLFAQLLVFLLESMQSPTRFSFLHWLPVFTGTILWTAVYKGLRFLAQFESPK